MAGENSADAAEGLFAAFGPGSRLGGYLLEEQIGAGGMAVVFRAVDERLGRRVALKILAPALVSDQAFRQRFIRESRAAAAVDDPYIIPVHEAGEADGVLFIAMRLVPGTDVRTLLHQEGPLAPGRAAAIISQVASALDAAHAAGLVHRDVKPANMLIDIRPGRPDHVYLADFGISKSATSIGLTGTGQFLGTPDYTAPEQIEGWAVDGRTDQYALACAAFELLAGEPPFQRDQGMAIIWAHLSAPPPPLSSRRPGLPAAADAVLAKALAKAPQDRYGSCREFAEALRQALGLDPYDRDAGAGRAAAAAGRFPGVPAPGEGGGAGMTRIASREPDTARPERGGADGASDAPGPPAPTPTRPSSRTWPGSPRQAGRGRPPTRRGSPRRRLMLAAAAITVAALGAAAGLAWASHPDGRGPGHTAGSLQRPPVSSFTGGVLTALPDRGEPATFLADHDGGPAGAIAVAVWSTATGKLIKVLPHTCCLGTQGAFPFPDLRHHRLFISTSLNDVYNVVDSSTGRVTGQLTMDASPAAISADGRKVAVQDFAGGGISIVRPADGVARHWTNVTPLSVNDITWSPDGQDLVLTTERGIDVLPIGQPGDIDSGRFYPADPSCQATNIVAIPGTSQIVDAEQCPRGVVLAYFDLKTAMTIRRVAVAGAYAPPRAIKVLAGLSVDGSGRHVIGEWDNPDGPNQNPVFVVRRDHTVVIGHAGVDFCGWY